MLVQLADSTIRYPEGIVEHVFVRVRESFVLADFVVMDMEGDLGVDLVLGRPFRRSAKARIDVGKGEIRFRVGREDMFFRFKKKEEQHFMIQQDSEGQALWGAPEPQPEQRPSAPKSKKKEKKVWGQEFGLVQFSRTSRRMVITMEKSRARRTLNDAPLPKVNWYLSHI